MQTQHPVPKSLNPFRGMVAPQSLLIVTPDAFMPALLPLVQHKNQSGMATVAVSISSLSPFFKGVDDPETIKNAIAYAHENLSTQYVMLVGDAHWFPVRFQFMHNGGRGISPSYGNVPYTEGGIPIPCNMGPGKGNPGDFFPSDLYYANLYHHFGEYPALAKGTFDNWDGNGNGLYNEGTWLDPSALLPPPEGSNPDKIDGFPDVAVGRIPAHGVADVTTYVNKIINYESSAPAAINFTFVGDQQYDPPSNGAGLSGGVNLTLDVVNDSGLGAIVPTINFLLIENEINTVIGPQSGWNYCKNCHGLFFAENPTLGVCPAAAGGPHDGSGSGNYSLGVNSPEPGQRSWKWCKKCQGLFFAGNSPGSCPAGGGHDDSESTDYYVLTADAAVSQQIWQANWQFCSRCHGMFYPQNGGVNPNGVCPAPGGGAHNASGSGYDLAQAVFSAAPPPTWASEKFSSTNWSAQPSDVTNAAKLSTWVSYMGHGGPQGWGLWELFGVFDAGATAGSASLPVVYACGCQTGRFLSDLPWNAQYVDVLGDTSVQTGNHGPFVATPSTPPGVSRVVMVDEFTGDKWGLSSPGIHPLPVIVAAPNPYDFDRPDQGFAFPWLLSGGAIAYFGEVVTMIPLAAKELETYLLAAYANQFEPILGDIYLTAQQKYWAAHQMDTGSGKPPFQGYGYQSISRFYLGFMVFFGDPSLRLPTLTIPKFGNNSGRK